ESAGEELADEESAEDASRDAGASEYLSPGNTGEGAGHTKEYSEEPNSTLVGILEEATNKGCGIAIDPNRPGGGHLFRFGDLMSLRQYRTFDAPRPLASGLVDPEPMGDYLVGQPPIHILPGYALDTLEEYLARQTGKEEVAVTALAQPKQDEYLHLLVP